MIMTKNCQLFHDDFSTFSLIKTQKKEVFLWGSLVSNKLVLLRCPLHNRAFVVLNFFTRKTGKYSHIVFNPSCTGKAIRSHTILTMCNFKTNKRILCIFVQQYLLSCNNDETDKTAGYFANLASISAKGIFKNDLAFFFKKVYISHILIVRLADKK
jgi:hypothetical protein